jgi:uncharacterized protein (TIGR00369 family)
MRFQDDGEDEVCSHYTVPARYQSYPGIVHGGILASMLDEVVARVSMIGDPHHFMMSVKLQVLYRQPVPVETPIRVVGKIIKLRGRLGRAEGKIHLPDDSVACEAAMTLADIPDHLLNDENKALLKWKVDE